MEWSKADRIDVLMRESQACRLSDRIVDWQAALWTISTQQMLITADGQADDAALQEFQYTIPSLHVVAHAGGVTQTRSWGGRYNGYCQQGGLEVVERSGFIGSGRVTAEEALQLLAAPNCPSGRMDVVLMPDQMMLQIHESIGHPLELDRILGDERNYAGTSFVTLDMFGTFQYGSPLLNVTYDPTPRQRVRELRLRRRRHRRAAHLPDPGRPAAAPARRHLVAAARAARGADARRRGDHARLRVEPAADRPHEQPQRRTGRRSSLDEMIAAIELGVLMKTNRSWSIDDSRNKFQFGCEWGRMIRDGQLAEVVRNPNYRGVSRDFWRSLAMVGTAETVRGDGHAVLRQGRAQPGDARRPREPGVPLQRGRRVRRGAVTMKELFFTLADHAFAGLEGSEVLLLNFSGEVTDFVRFNHGAGAAADDGAAGAARPDADRRHAHGTRSTLTLAGTPLQDRGTVTAAVQSLRAELAAAARRSVPAVLDRGDALRARRRRRAPERRVGDRGRGRGRARHRPRRPAGAAARSCAASPVRSARVTGTRSMRSCSTGRSITPATRR